jgi:hypothetical protein
MRLVLFFEEKTTAGTMRVFFCAVTKLRQVCFSRFNLLTVIFLADKELRDTPGEGTG